MSQAIERLHLACPHCHTVNRIPSNKLHEKPICGACRKTLFVGKPTDLDDRTFADYVSETDLPILVDFWAPWCGPCQMMAPAFVQAAAQLEPEALLAKVNTEAATQIAQRFNIRGIPTLILFHDGDEVDRRSGALPLEGIVRWTRERIHSHT